MGILMSGLTALSGHCLDASETTGKKPSSEPAWVTLKGARANYEIKWGEQKQARLNLSDEVRIVGEIGSREMNIDGTKFILTKPPKVVNNQVKVWKLDRQKVVEPALNPPPPKDDPIATTVVLDPGHGGHDSGAQSSFGDEKRFALDTAMRAKDLLEKQGFNVEMTRETDKFLSLEERVEAANQYDNAIFVSIHYNHGGSQSTGVESYRLTPTGLPSTADQPNPRDAEPRPGNINDQENLTLAKYMHDAIMENNNLPDRGVRQARFYVIKNSKNPAVLLEGGFLSNETEAELLATEEYRQELANSVTAAAVSFREKLNANEDPLLVQILNNFSDVWQSHEWGQQLRGFMQEWSNLLSQADEVPSYAHASANDMLEPLHEMFAQNLAQHWVH